MKSFASNGSLTVEPAARRRLRRTSRALARPLAVRLRFGFYLVHHAAAALPTSLADARELARSAISIAIPSAEDEQRPSTRPLLPIALDVGAAAFAVETESWLLAGRIENAEVPAALARRLALEGSGDPLVFGSVERMLGLRAWLCGHLGRSLRHLEAAIRDFAEAGDAKREAEAWERTAFVLEQAALQAEAELALSQARRLVEREAQLTALRADVAGAAAEPRRAANPRPPLADPSYLD